MSEAEEPGKLRDIARLVSKAVKGLPQEEQRAVFEYLLKKEIAQRGGALSFGRFVHDAQPVFRARRSMGSEKVTIPVRLSEAQHQRLKQWAAKHNFPMAVVVRGLIERLSMIGNGEPRLSRSS